MASKNRKSGKSGKSADAKSKGSAATAEKPAGVVKNRAEGLKVVATIDIPVGKLRMVDEFRGRAFPVGDEEVVARADSMRIHGQQQPIQVRAVPKTDEYEVIFGNTRTRAGNLIASGYTNLDGKEVEAKPDYKLRAEVVEVDAEQAFLRNVVENAQRTNCSPIDNAINQQKLRDEYQYSDVKIAQLYGYSSSASVSRLKKLLELEPEFQEEVHTGVITMNAGFLLFDVKGEDAEATKTARTNVRLKAADIAKSRGDDSIGSTAMQEAIKAWRKELKDTAAAANGTGGTSTPETGGDTGTATAPETGTAGGDTGGSRTPKYALTLKTFKDGVEAIAKDEKCPANVSQVCGLILDYITGGTDTQGFATALAGFIRE